MLKDFVRYIVIIIVFSFCTVTGAIAQNDVSLNDTTSVLLSDSTKLDSTSSLKNDTAKLESANINRTKEKEPKNQALLESKVDYKSFDTIISFLNERRIILRGNAKVVYEDIELTANHIEIDFNKNEIFAKGIKDSSGNVDGSPVFKEGLELYESRELRYNFKTQKGIITDVITEQDGGFLHSQRTKKHNDNIIDLKAGKYTTCDHEHPHYYIAMSKARVIQDDKIVSGPMYLVIKDVPTPFAIPFGFFPFTKEKTSGLIIPSYGESDRRGFSLENLGYYWALNDYVDLKVLTSIYSYGSFKGSIMSRYKKRYRFGGNLNFMLEKIIESEKGLNDYVNTSAYTLQWQHRQDPKARPNSNFSANVNLKSTSANRYSTNLDNYLESTVNSSINYSHNLPGTPFSFNAQLRHTLNTRDSTVTMTLPSFNLNMKRLTPFESKKSNKPANFFNKIGITYKSRFENQFSVHEEDLFKREVIDQFRFGVKHDLGVSSSAKFLKFFNFSPSASYSERWYFNSIRKQYDENLFLNDNDTYTYGKTMTDTISEFNRIYDYNMSANVNTTVYGRFRFMSFMPIEEIRMVHTPAIGYSYKPNFTLDRYGYYGEVEDDPNETEYSYYSNGIYGVPGGSKSGSINFSLNNQIGMKIKTPNDSVSKTKKIDMLKQLSFNTSYNIVADSMNWSPLSMRASTNLFQKVNINASATLDPYALDPITYKKIDKFQYNVDNKIGRLTRADIAIGFSIDSKLFEGDEVEDDSESSTYDYYDYFDIPWSFKLDYKWRYSKPENVKTVNQTVGLSGNFSVTSMWKIGFRTGYDFENRKISATSFNITRDLHCWIMSFRWIPFGRMQSYFFTIGVKSSMLQDLKYDKRNNWYDRGY